MAAASLVTLVMVRSRRLLRMAVLPPHTPPPSSPPPRTPEDSGTRGCSHRPTRTFYTCGQSNALRTPPTWGGCVGWVVLGGGVARTRALWLWLWLWLD